MPLIDPQDIAEVLTMRIFASGNTLPDCRYWDESSKSWASAGMVQQGVQYIDGRYYLDCLATHLTEFSSSEDRFIPQINDVSACLSTGTLRISL